MKKNPLYILTMAILAGSILFCGCSKGGTTPTTPADDPPAAVTLSAAGNTASSVSLTWTKNGDADFASYKVYRAASAGVSASSNLLATITAQSDTAFADTALSPNHTYYYAVYAVDGANQSTKSNEASATTTGLTSLAIGIDPRVLTVANGAKFSLGVWVESVTDLFGSSFELSYDNTKIVADSAKAESFLGTTVIFYQHYATDTASIAVTRMAGAGGVSGYGTLATVYFHAVGAGSTTINFTTDLALRKEDGASVTGFSTISKWVSQITVQ